MHFCILFSLAQDTTLQNSQKNFEEWLLFILHIVSESAHLHLEMTLYTLGTW